MQQRLKVYFQNDVKAVRHTDISQAMKGVIFLKATYRAKFNALRAINDGYSLITIRRRNGTVAVWLEDIIITPNGEKVPEHEADIYSLKERALMTFRELMNY